MSGGADGKVDYNKIVADFGVSLLTQDLVARVERLTGRPAHPFLKRGIFFAHRDLHEILDCYERGEPFYLYTGRVRCVVCGCVLLRHACASGWK